MARKICTRCGEPSFSTEPHLCSDLKRRLARREKQVQAILPIVRDVGGDGYVEAYYRDAAEAIVKTLAGMGVQDD